DHADAQQHGHRQQTHQLPQHGVTPLSRYPPSMANTPGPVPACRTTVVPGRPWPDRPSMKPAAGVKVPLRLCRVGEYFGEGRPGRRGAGEPVLANPPAAALSNEKGEK